MRSLTEILSSISPSFVLLLLYSVLQDPPYKVLTSWNFLHFLNDCYLPGFRHFDQVYWQINVIEWREKLQGKEILQDCTLKFLQKVEPF